MSIFRKKKVFGLDWALKAEAIKPIPEDHASTVIALLEAGNIPVTAGAEAEAKIDELNDLVKGVEEGIETAKTGIKDAEAESATFINNLKADLKATVEAILRVVSKKVVRVDKACDEKVARLEAKIEATYDRADAKGDSLREWGENLVAKTTREMNKKIAQAENNLMETIGGLKIQIVDLETDAQTARAEIGTLEPIAKKWTLPTTK